ncbi:MAG: ABC transporter permease [Saprospiraceae bacterium]
MNSLFKLRGELTKTQAIFSGILGIIVLLLFWWSLAEYKSDQVPNVTLSKYPSSIGADAKTLAIIDSLVTVDSLALANATSFKKVYPIVPRPIDVVNAVPIMINEEKLIANTGLSVWRNLQGYLWAMMICVPLGFIIGLFPLFRGMFNNPIDALRFLPLTALTGLFMLAFRDQTENMKVSFLAFGIIVYLLPIVVQRIKEVAEIYLKTTFTLGATDWQTIRTVYFPAVMSKLMDDVRVITAISWTYIIIAELLGKEGGIGALMHTNGRQGQTEKVFVGLAVIILVGYLQDRIFVFMDKRLFPHKYYPTTIVGIKESQYGIYTILFVVIVIVILAMLAPSIYASISPFIIGVFLVSSLIIIGFGEFKIFKFLRNA